MKIRCVLSLALCLCMLLGLVLPAHAVTTTTPGDSNNADDHEYLYERWSSPICSYLEPHEDGTVTRVEYTGEELVAELYDGDLNFISGQTIEMELPLFGGFYHGETHNFLVFGQENPTEDNTREVVRVVCYTRDWQRVGSASLYGANTTVPFRAGTVRFAECNGYLYIRTCHEMYMSSDGLNHQSNMTLNIRIADMTITDSFYNVGNINYGYVSHSFNQFIAVDGKDLVAVDHGDAHPRSVVLFRYKTPAGQDRFTKMVAKPLGNGQYIAVCADYVNVLPIGGMSGSNDTGVSLGGFEISDSAYLIVGNTGPQGENYNAEGQRSIFVSVTSKEDFSTNGTTVRYLTNYQEGDEVKISNPQFTKISDNKFALIWTEETDASLIMRYAFLDGQGQVIGKIYTGKGTLSDCQPVVVGNKLVWYVTSASAPAFFTIDLDDPEQVTCDHVYAYEYEYFPRSNTPGQLSSYCVICHGEGPYVTVPALSETEHYILSSYASKPTCTENGTAYYNWKDYHKYNVTNWNFRVSVKPTGHNWVDDECSDARVCANCGKTAESMNHDWAEATCTQPATCKICGYTQGEPLPHQYSCTKETQPSCTAAGERIYACTDCGHQYSEVLEAEGHDYSTEVIAPGCTEGYDLHTCLRCGDSYKDNYTDARGHAYDTSGYVTEPSCTEPGVAIRTCANCGDEKYENVPPSGHDYDEYVVKPACLWGGYSVFTCLLCGDRYIANHTPPQGHSYEGVVTPPTVTQGGYTTYTCSSCGNSYVGDQVPALGMSVSGTLSGFAAGGEVTVELLKDGQVAYSVTASGNRYSIEGVAPGEYILRLSKANHATREYAVTVGSEDVVLDAEISLKGDINGDGKVTIKDLRYLLQHVNESSLLEGYALACGDLNNDGNVTLKDFQRVLRHVNETLPLY